MRSEFKSRNRSHRIGVVIMGPKSKKRQKLSEYSRQRRRDANGGYFEEELADETVIDLTEKPRNSSGASGGATMLEEAATALKAHAEIDVDSSLGEEFSERV
jgi:hypothetical protein